MLSCEGLRAHDGLSVLFQDLGISIGPGTCLMIRGPNGSGKTTLLEMLVGLCLPSAGRILWHGNDIRSLRDTYGQVVQYVGHRLALQMERSVIENVGFWSCLRGTMEMLSASMYFFRLQDMADEPCHRLSLGWQKRVALARLLACYAELWVLDEPDTHLDQQGLTLLEHAITTRTAEGGMVVMTTHQPEQPIRPNARMVTLQMQDFHVSRIYTDHA